MKKLLTFALVIVLATGGLAYTLQDIMKVGSAHAARTVCSGVFISRRAPEDIQASDLDQWPFYLLRSDVDHDRRMVTSSWAGFFPVRAAYTPQFGSRLLASNEPDPAPSGTPLPAIEAPLWPAATLPSSPDLSYDPAQLSALVQAAFNEPGDDSGVLATRAVLVVHKDRLLAEAYADGFGPETPLVGWSVTKSVASALTGVMVSDGLLDLAAPASEAVTAWSDPADPRHEITVDQVLHMTTSLSFEENYSDPRKDALRMFNLYPDFGAYAADKDLLDVPGSRWSYSSGTSAILSNIQRAAIEAAGEDYPSYPWRRLFDRLGISSAVFETDGTGTFAGSSYLFMTARDWARFGLLYLHDGVWDGERILPEGWVDFTATPVPQSPKGIFGAHWWLNKGLAEDASDRQWPLLPPDTIAAQGYAGQAVIVIPSMDLVLIHLGHARPKDVFNTQDFAAPFVSFFENAQKVAM